MGLLSVGFSRVCKYGKDHRLEQCHFCEFDLRIISLEAKLSSLAELKCTVSKFEETCEKIFDTVTRINSIKEREPFETSGKKPHKCPVCDGKGEIIVSNSYMLMSLPPKYPTDKCSSCQGKGIIWG